MSDQASDMTEDGSNGVDPTYKPEETLKKKDKKGNEFSESSESPTLEVSKRASKRKREKETKKGQGKKSKVMRESPVKKAKTRQSKSDVGIVDLTSQLEAGSPRAGGESSKQDPVTRKSQTDVASKKLNVASGSSKKGGGRNKSTKGLESCPTTPKSNTKPLTQKNFRVL